MFSGVGTRRTTKGGSLPNRGGEKQQACRSPAAISGFLLFLPLFFFVLCLVVVAEARSPEQQRETFPNGIEPDLFQSQVFDPDAPFCHNRDPCGFYSLALDGTGHFKWIKSWCQCPTDHECIYDKTDKKVRVFRLNCAPKDPSASLPQLRHQQQGQKQKRRRKHKRTQHAGGRMSSSFLGGEDRHHHSSGGAASAMMLSPAEIISGSGGVRSAEEEEDLLL